MRNLKVIVGQGGIRKWASQMDDFQSYICHMPWEAGELVDMAPVPFTKMAHYSKKAPQEIQEEEAANQAQHCLANAGWPWKANIFCVC